MANQFLNAVEYANVMLLLAKNQLVWGRLVDGQFKDQVTDENGLSINVKAPPRFIAGTGAALQTQDLVVGNVNVNVNQYTNVHISVGDLEYVESYNSLMQNETMKSAASTIAHAVDSYIGNLTKGFHSWVAGTAPGTEAGNASDPSKIISSPSEAFAAHTRLMSQGVPNSDLNGVVAFSDGQSIRGSLLSDFLPNNLTALQRVKIPLISEVDWYATQQTPALTTGSRTASATGLINGANQNVNYRDVKGTPGANTRWQQTLITDTWNSGCTFAVGDVFTIANVYAWDWRQNVAHNYLQQFTVINALTATGANATLTISPAIVVQGTNDATGNANANTAFAVVDSIPADNAAITFVGTASTNYRIKSVFQKRAIALVSARLQMPFTGVASFAVDPDTGIAIRYWRGSDIATGNHVHRWDLIYGGAVMDPFLGTRICGT